MLGIQICLNLIKICTLHTLYTYGCCANIDNDIPIMGYGAIDCIVKHPHCMYLNEGGLDQILHRNFRCIVWLYNELHNCTDIEVRFWIVIGMKCSIYVARRYYSCCVNVLCYNSIFEYQVMWLIRLKPFGGNINNGIPTH